MMKYEEYSGLKIFSDRTIAPMPITLTIQADIVFEKIEKKIHSARNTSSRKEEGKEEPANNLFKELIT